MGSDEFSLIIPRTFLSTPLLLTLTQSSCSHTMGERMWNFGGLFRAWGGTPPPVKTPRGSPQRDRLSRGCFTITSSSRRKEVTEEGRVKGGPLPKNMCKSSYLGKGSWLSWSSDTARVISATWKKVLSTGLPGASTGQDADS